jgi:hypothetical protein
MKRAGIVCAALLLAACADPYHGADPVAFERSPLITYDQQEIFGTPPDMVATRNPDGSIEFRRAPREGKCERRLDKDGKPVRCAPRQRA